MYRKSWQGCTHCASTGYRFSKRKRNHRQISGSFPNQGPTKGTGQRGTMVAHGGGGDGGDTAEQTRTPKLRDRLVPCKSCNSLGIVPLENSEQPDLVNNYTPEQKPFVLIAGGGLGGCALALALQHRNIPCRILEKDKSFDARAQGYGLTMQQASMTLKRLGYPNLKDLGGAALSHTSYLTDGQVVSSYGRTIHSTVREKKGNGKGDAQRFNIQLPRQALRQFLIDKLAPDTIDWGNAFEGCELQSNGDVLVNTSKGKTDCQLLVGADGIWSRVRNVRLGTKPHRYLGVIVILGRAPCDHPLAENRVFQTLGGETRIYTMPFDNNGITMWQLSFPLALNEARALSDQGKTALLAEARRRCAGWHEPVVSLLNDTIAEDVTGYPAFDRPPPELGPSGFVQDGDDFFDQECASRVVLLGDAAHPMSPFKGQGANQALSDGWSLARCLASTNSVRDAIQQFEEEMVGRVRSKVEGSAEAARVLHSLEAVDLRASRLVT